MYSFEYLVIKTVASLKSFWWVYDVITSIFYRNGSQYGVYIISYLISWRGRILKFTPTDISCGMNFHGRVQGGSMIYKKKKKRVVVVAVGSFIDGCVRGLRGLPSKHKWKLKSHVVNAVAHLDYKLGIRSKRRVVLNKDGKGGGYIAHTSGFLSGELLVPEECS